jgi:hypothetical protein
LQPALAWSFSRSRLYKLCPRAFYFAHIKKSILSDYEAAISLRSLLGLSVHYGISQELSRWAKGHRPDAHRAEEAAEAYILNNWEHRNQNIIEIRNGLNPNLDLVSKLRAKASHLLRDFFRFTWPRFEIMQYILHEKIKTFSIGNIEVRVQVDLCTKNDTEEIVITDWKTGRTPIDPDTFQLNVYALWAKNEFQVPVDKILTQIVNIRTGAFFIIPTLEQNLLSTVDQIKSEAYIWIGNGEAEYATIPELVKCLSCPFLVVCSEGSKQISPDPDLMKTVLFDENLF